MAGVTRTGPVPGLLVAAILIASIISSLFITLSLPHGGRR